MPGVPLATLLPRPLASSLALPPQEEDSRQREAERRRKAEEDERRAQELAEEQARVVEEAIRLGEEEEMLDAVTLTLAALSARQLDRCRASLASAFQRLATIFHRRGLCLSVNLPNYASPSSPASCIYCQACAGPASSSQHAAAPLAEDSDVYDAMLAVLLLPREQPLNVSASPPRLEASSLHIGPVASASRCSLSDPCNLESTAIQAMKLPWPSREHLPSS